MNPKAFKDRRAAGLLDRVRQDISQLRDDIGDLLTHTKRETLPNSAKEFADQARNQLAAGGAYAASRLRKMRGIPEPRESHTAGWLGGTILAGALAYGIYALCKSCCDMENQQDEG